MSASIGPFIQQDIKSYACQQPLHNISTAASYVNPGLVLSGEKTNHLYPDLKMMTAALEGILGSNSKTLLFDCPSGNSDFAPCSSPAYWSSCTDITTRVQKHYGPLHLETYTILPWNYTIHVQDCVLSFESIGRSAYLEVFNSCCVFPWGRLRVMGMKTLLALKILPKSLEIAQLQRYC